jgi:hypothetical protein
MCSLSELSKEEHRALKALQKAHAKQVAHSNKARDKAHKHAQKTLNQIAASRIAALQACVAIVTKFSLDSCTDVPPGDDEQWRGALDQLLQQESAVVPAIAILCNVQLTRLNVANVAHVWQRVISNMRSHISDSSASTSSLQQIVSNDTLQYQLLLAYEYVQTLAARVRDLQLPHCTALTALHDEIAASPVSVAQLPKALADHSAPSIVHPPNASELVAGISLTNFELQALLELSNALAYAEQRTAATLHQRLGCVVLHARTRYMLLQLLTHATANQSFNTTMSQLAKLESIPYGISHAAVNIMRTFSFKSKHLGDLQPLQLKLTTLWNQICDTSQDASSTSTSTTTATSTTTTTKTKATTKATTSKKSSKHSKLTLRDVGIARSLYKWGSDFSIFEQFNSSNIRQAVVLNLASLCHTASMTTTTTTTTTDQCNGDTTAATEPQQLATQATRYQQLYQSFQQLRQTMHQIQAYISNDSTYQSGDLLLIVWSRKKKTKQGNAPPAHFRFMMSFTKYEHTAKIYRNVVAANGPLNEVRLSHMIRTYHDSELAIEDIVCAEIYRLQVAALITDKSSRQKLEQHYGAEWQHRVQEQYARFESELHSVHQSALSNITNPLSRVMNIGTASLMPWKKTTKKAENFELVWKQLFSAQGQNHQQAADNADAEQDHDLQMTCSEFALKSFIAALYQLNAHLEQELNEVGTEHAPYIAVPFPANERMETIKPERLREMLLAKKAIKSVDMPARIADLVDVHA